MKPYDGFILLCGGPSDVSESQPISVRDGLQRELAKNQELNSLTRVAEHYKDWSADSIYSDLVEFERHIAELSAVIVLILESAGSIAELGLFAAIEGFRKKLLVVIETDHYNADSFIKLGPIDFLEKTLSNMAECHRWRQSDKRIDHESLREIQPELVSAIIERTKSPLPPRAFSTTSWADVGLLICELVSIFSALTFKEIQSYLKHFDVSASNSELQRYLYILEKLDFIHKEPKGSQRFYISKDQRSFVSFAYKDASFDPIRFRMEVIAYYEKEDKKRHRALQEARRRHDY